MAKVTHLGCAFGLGLECTCKAVWPPASRSSWGKGSPCGWRFIKVTQPTSPGEPGSEVWLPQTRTMWTCHQEEDEKRCQSELPGTLSWKTLLPVLTCPALNTFHLKSCLDHVRLARSFSSLVYDLL